jgi:hypothetical protein
MPYRHSNGVLALAAMSPSAGTGGRCIVTTSCTGDGMCLRSRSRYGAAIGPAAGASDQDTGSIFGSRPQSNKC